MIKRKTSVLFRNQKRCLNSTMNIKLQPLTYVLAWPISVYDAYIQNMTCEPYSGDFKNSHSACISSFHRIPVCVSVCVCAYVCGVCVVCMRVCVRVCVWCVHVCMCVYVCVCVVGVCVCVRVVAACVCVCVGVCVRVVRVGVCGCV